MDWKLLIGLLLGFGIGLGCQLGGLPAPAPPVLVGALLVLAMTSGYVLADRFLARPQALRRGDCGGPSGHGVGGTSP